MRNGIKTRSIHKFWKALTRCGYWVYGYWEQAKLHDKKYDYTDKKK